MPYLETYLVVSSIGATEVGPLLLLAAFGYFCPSSVVAARVVVAAAVKASAFGFGINVSSIGGSGAH